MYIVLTSYILNTLLGRFEEGSVFCDCYDYLVIIDYLHILFHGNFVELEDGGHHCRHLQQREGLHSISEYFTTYVFNIPP